MASPCPASGMLGILGTRPIAVLVPRTRLAKSGRKAEIELKHLFGILCHSVMRYEGKSIQSERQLPEGNIVGRTPTAKLYCLSRVRWQGWGLRSFLRVRSVNS